MTHRSKGGRCGLLNPTGCPAPGSYYMSKAGLIKYTSRGVQSVHIVKVLDVTTGYKRMGFKETTVYYEDTLAREWEGRLVRNSIEWSEFLTLFEPITEDIAQQEVGLLILHYM